MKRKAFFRIAAAAFAVLLTGSISSGAAELDDLDALLESLRLKHNIPALAGAVVTGEGLWESGRAGTRKSGEDIPVMPDDLWHFGSNTKAMTAALIGVLVEEGALRWDTSMEEAFPEWAAEMPEAMRKVTLLHLLSHRSGLSANLIWPVFAKKGSLREQRQEAVKTAVSGKLLSHPGEQFLYSNLGYVVAGAVAEKAANASWEELLIDRVCRPLGMATMGFGGLGTPGLVDQPWPHWANGRPLPKNGSDIDNPAVLGPAGTGHGTLGDWAKFIADFLRGAAGEKALMRPETYESLITPPLGGDYALGWVVTERPWGGGKVLVHNGSNNMNFATVWVAPLRHFAVLVVTNQGGPAAQKACDEAAGALIKRYLDRKPSE